MLTATHTIFHYYLFSSGLLCWFFFQSILSHSLPPIQPLFFFIFSGLVLGFCVCKETVIDLHNIKTAKWVKTSFIQSIKYSITSFELSHKCHYLFVFVFLFACFFLFKNLENKSIISLTKVKYTIDIFFY